MTHRDIISISRETCRAVMIAQMYRLTWLMIALHAASAPMFSRALILMYRLGKLRCALRADRIVRISIVALRLCVGAPARRRQAAASWR